MSTRFVVVKEEPKELSKDSMVIKEPDFLDEIKENKQREPRGGHTSPTHLRYIAGSIGARYDQDLSAYTIKPHLFEGRKYDSDADLSKIVVEMLRAQYPKIFQSYIEYKIKSRPAGTKLIYFVGDHKETKPFLNNGFSLVDESDLDGTSKAAKKQKNSAD